MVFLVNGFSFTREYGSTLYVGLGHVFPPTNTKFKPLLLPTQTGMPYTKLTSTEHHISSLHSHLWVQLCAGSAFPQPDKNDKFLRFFIIIIRECGSTLYVGLAHAVPPTNTKFKALLLPTQAGIPYTNTHKHITSYLKSTLTFMAPAMCWKWPYKSRKFLRFFIIIIKFNFKIFFSNTSSNEILPRSACKCLQNLYQSVAIHLKYVLLVHLLSLATKVFRLIIGKKC